MQNMPATELASLPPDTAEPSRFVVLCKAYTHWYVWTEGKEHGPVSKQRQLFAEKEAHAIAKRLVDETTSEKGGRKLTVKVVPLL